MNDVQNKKPIVWTIAGSDSCAGAGLQADLATFNALGVQGASIVTVVTAQNPHVVNHVQSCGAEMITQQINSLREALPPRAIKLGALGSADNIRAITEYLKNYSGPIICDPVIQASAGGQLLEPDAIDVLQKEIFPCATLITPNIPEAEILLGMSIRSTEDMIRAAKKFLERGIQQILIKGGHLTGAMAQDYFLSNDTAFWINSPKQVVAVELMAGPSIHGTGCTLSAAITAALALGHDIKDALIIAKMYLNQGLRNSNCVSDSGVFIAHSGWPQHGADFPSVAVGKIKTQDYCFPRWDSESIGFYPIVDSATWVERLLVAGVRTIQLRMKNHSKENVETEIRNCIHLAKHYDARLIINDHWDLAIKYKAFGVHIGQDDLEATDFSAIEKSGLRLGISTHSFFEIARAHAFNPSYIAFGTIYKTSSKIMNFPPQGLEKLKYWVTILPYPIVAIGGIGLPQIREVLATGVSGIALISAVTQAEHPEQAAREFLHLC